MHKLTDPPILYFGTPVVLISTVNNDGTYNIAPISSVFWLGWRCMIGISAFSKTTENLIRTGQCVLNLPSVGQVAAVNALALKTGADPVPEGKLQKGYEYEPNKFEIAGLTPVKSALVDAPRALECPVNMEAEIASVHPMASDNPDLRGRTLSIELKITKVHVDESIIMNDYINRVDPDKWRPLIMSFREFYGLGDKVSPSRQAAIPEHYRTAEEAITKEE